MLEIAAGEQEKEQEELWAAAQQQVDQAIHVPPQPPKEQEKDNITDMQQKPNEVDLELAGRSLGLDRSFWIFV